MARRGKAAPPPRRRRRGATGERKPLGLALALLRAIKGKTRAEVARAAGLKEAQVEEIERGRRPRLAALARLLAALDVTDFDLGLTCALLADRAEARASRPAQTGSRIEKVIADWGAEVEEMTLLLLVRQLLPEAYRETFANFVRDLFLLPQLDLETLLLRENDPNHR